MRTLRWCCLLMASKLVFAEVIGCNSNSSTQKVSDKSPSAVADTPVTAMPNDETATNQEAGADDEGDPEIMAALAYLSAEDRVLAETQRFCAMQPTVLLGSMGTPFKVMIDDQPVFLCCEGCKEAALRDPEETLATVAELKRKNSADK